MTCSFKRGTVRISADEEPNWADVAMRLTFARDLNGIPVHFLRARREGDAWVVPYLSAESEDKPDAADIVLERYTPYEVPEANRVDVLMATADELEVMLRLAKGETRAVGAKDITPEPQKPEPAPTTDPDRGPRRRRGFLRPRRAGHHREGPSRRTAPVLHKRQGPPRWVLGS